MKTLPARLEAALKHAKKDRQALVEATGASRQAVNKWFEGTSSNLKMAHLFAVADTLTVEPRWLATGEGEMKLGKSTGCSHLDIPPHRIALIRPYSTLPEEERRVARTLIETLSWSHHPRKDEYVTRISKSPLSVHDK
jgi:transcriptional regulator with XRE-family HTH domain